MGCPQDDSNSRLLIRSGSVRRGVQRHPPQLLAGRNSSMAERIGILGPES